jgi:predicted Rossmann fold flavoprotein
VLLIEKSSQLLSKVLVSGGGRCNVTHACFDPQELVSFYPRGGKALLGMFSRFQPRDTVEWFAERDVALNQEEDGRIFPASNNAKTIVSCLLKELEHKSVDVLLSEEVIQIEKNVSGFSVTTNNSTYSSERVLLATGGTPSGYSLAEKLGHALSRPVPSLFTFNVPGSPLLDLAGIAVEKATLSLSLGSHVQTGPLLLTHWGFSGPVVLKLSAWAARDLFAHNYCATLYINWIGDGSFERTRELLLQQKRQHPAKKIAADPLFLLPKSLWTRLVALAGVQAEQEWRSVSTKTLGVLAQKLIRDPYEIQGKGAYKQEFVTAGGVRLEEINCKTMESKLVPHVYFAGEILDVDGVTGGFNFQNAWTTGFIVGQGSGHSDH